MLVAPSISLLSASSEREDRQIRGRAGRTRENRMEARRTFALVGLPSLRFLPRRRTLFVCCGRLYTLPEFPSPPLRGISCGGEGKGLFRPGRDSLKRQSFGSRQHPSSFENDFSRYLHFVVAFERA